MLSEQTLARMQEMKLFGMVRRYEELTAQPEHLELERDEFLGLLIDAEATWRDNNRMQRLLRNARLKQPACLEDIDYRHPRGLHRPTMLELAEGHWLKTRRNVLISGPTGVGKSFIACALGNSVCRAGKSVFYLRAPRLFNTLFQSRADGSYLKCLARLARFNLLIIDDLGLTPMNEMERKDFLEIVEESNLTSSLVVSSQVPIKDWYKIIGDPTIADAVCDRLLHNAYRIELKGESMRKAGRLPGNPETK
jgi:DNA replication protein DnaC